MALTLTRRAPVDPRTALTVQTAADVASFDLIHRILAVVFGFALFMGLGAQVVGALGLSGVAFGAMPASLVGLVVIVALSLLAGRDRIELIGCAALAAVLVVAVIVLHSQVLSGAAQALNYFEASLGARSSVYNLPFVTGGSGDIVVFACVFAAVLAAMCAEMALRGNTVLVTVLALLVVAASLLGFGGYTPFALLFVAGILGCFVLNLSGDNDVRSPRGVLLTLVGIAVVAAVCGGVLAGVSRVASLDAAGPRQAIAQAIDRIRYGGDSWAMPNGDLAATGPLMTSERAALTVTVPEDTTAGYLRGFVGEVYTGDAWTTLPSDAVTESRDLFYWLEQDGFSASSQLADAAEASTFDEVTPQTAEIAYEGARNTYAYLPYAYAGGAEATDVTDQAFVVRDVRESRLGFKVAGSALQKAYRIQTAVVDAQDAEASGIEGYLADEAAYREFVYDNYLGIPLETAGVFASLVGASEALPADEAKEHVLQLLDDTVVYREDVDAPAAGSDFVTYFLTDSKKGYSVHYATAATLLMRYYGVPARYVEGYLSLDEGGTVELTEENAHAWCEYYLDGVGWVVFEATPAYRDGGFYEPSENARVSEFGELYNMGANRQSTWQPQKKNDSDEREERTDQDGIWHFNPLWFLLGLLIGAAAAFAVRAYLLRRRFAEMVDRFISVNPNIAIPEMFSYALHIAWHGLGCTFENVPYDRQAEAVAQTGLCSAESFEAAALANEYALFSGEPATEDDRIFMLEFVGEVWENVHARCGLARRLWLTWVKGVL